MWNRAKSTIINTMVTTAATLVILSIFKIVFNQDYIRVRGVLEILGANAVINCGLLLTHKIESRFIILEYLLDISYIIAVLVVFGAVFNWYSTAPVWVLVVMAVMIYLFAIIITITRIQSSTRKINELLRKRREKNDDSAS